MGADMSVSTCRIEERSACRDGFARGVERDPVPGRSGGGWRMLPKDFPPWQTVYWWFRRFVRRFMFQTIQDVALMLDRERV
jgi:hypothetical protein